MFFILPRPYICFVYKKTPHYKVCPGCKKTFFSMYIFSNLVALAIKTFFTMCIFLMLHWIQTYAKNCNSVYAKKTVNL